MAKPSTTGPTKQPKSDNNHDDIDGAEHDDFEEYGKKHEPVNETNPENEPKSVIFNYSSIVLTNTMKSLLNRGLNFCVTPLKLDITEVLVDFKRFERSVIWREFFYGREDEEVQYEKPIFKTRKYNLPSNYAVPKPLKRYLGSVKSELLDHRNRQQANPNLPVEEIQAMKELIKLQRQRQVIIKACDKGAGLIILDFKDYLRACYEHLVSRLENKEGLPQNYYKEVQGGFIEEAKLEIKDVLVEAQALDLITDAEFKAMDPEDCDPARFYCNFKVHKPHEPGQVPPVRPIISGSGSTTEMIGQFVDHHLKKMSTKHPTYLQDTPHFLRVMESVRRGDPLPPDSILVTADITGAYQNIPQDDGINCLYQALEEREDKGIPSEFVTRLMELILKFNLFEFDGALYQQLVGTSMGSKPAPNYANIYLAKRLDKEISRLGYKYGKKERSALTIFKRFLDDIFLIFKGTTKKLHEFFDDMNKIHPTLKFTLNHTSPDNESQEDRCSCETKESIPFLDTSVSIVENRLAIDLYKKETDRNQYLMPSSCHPKMTTSSIPYSLSLRIVRICTDPMRRNQRLSELKSYLLERGYSELMVDNSIEKARKVPREKALRKIQSKQTNKQPVFVLRYDPRLPAVQAAQAKHWRAMTYNDQYLASVFPQPPMTAFKRQRNLRDILIRSKVPEYQKKYPERNIRGMQKCGKNCTACPFIKQVKEIKINQKEKWKINRKVTCDNTNTIYLIECSKEYCKENRYIGESGRPLRYRLADHRGYVRNKNTSQATGAHFNLPGHSLDNMSITIIEQVRMRDKAYRKERESYHINKFNTYYGGMNRKP